MNKTNILDIIKNMTIEEKAGQLTQLPSMYFDIDSSMLTGTACNFDIEKKWLVGSILGKLDAKSMRAIQTKAIEKSRFNIPIMFMTDIIHGYKTIYPVPLALSCSFDKELINKCARLSAIEGSAAGYQVTFSPMVDLVRDARWGRVMESFGEDKRLQSDFGSEMVKGYMGDGLDKPDSLAACVKHFAGYGAACGGRDYNTADISEYSLQNDYFPSFKACVDAGAKFVMAAFESLNGTPATANKWLLDDILRKQMNFDGVVISDWGAVNELICHGVAQNELEAGKKALESGIQIEMSTTSILQNATLFIEQNNELEKLLDSAVEKILLLKLELGLFDDPYRNISEKREKECLYTQEMKEFARKSACDSAVLLENNGVLPLKPNSNITLAGPYAKSCNLLGPWSIDGEIENVISVYEGLEKSELNINNVYQTDFEKITDSEIDNILESARKSEFTVLVLGERESWSGEAGSRSDISLPKAQIKLLKTLKNHDIKIIVVLFNGRPLDLRKVKKHADAILEMWFSGTQTGNAVADLLTGKANPSGKLTMSFPYNVGQIPVYYNCLSTGRPSELLTNEPRYKSHYLDIPNEPLYYFGYGLSYTSFDTNVKEFNISEDITITVDVKNTGEFDGAHVIQIYSKKSVSCVSRPKKELASYEKVFLKSGETKTVKLTVKNDIAKIWTQNDGFMFDSGEYELFLDDKKYKIFIDNQGKFKE